MERLDVMFRTDRDGEVVAVFPDTPGDYVGGIECYAHIGQHSTCSLAWLNQTRPATTEESEPLLLELRSIYERGPEAVELRVVRRRTASHRKAFEEARRAACRAVQAEPRGAPWSPVQRAATIAS